MAQIIHNSKSDDYREYSLTEIIVEWIEKNIGNEWRWTAIDNSKDRLVLRRKR